MQLGAHLSLSMLAGVRLVGRAGAVTMALATAARGTVGCRSALPTVTLGSGAGAVAVGGNRAVRTFAGRPRDDSGFESGASSRRRHGDGDRGGRRGSRGLEDPWGNEGWSPGMGGKVPSKGRYLSRDEYSRSKSSAGHGSGVRGNGSGSWNLPKGSRGGQNTGRGDGDGNGSWGSGRGDGKGGDGRGFGRGRDSSFDSRSAAREGRFEDNKRFGDRSGRQAFDDRFGSREAERGAGRSRDRFGAGGGDFSSRARAALAAEAGHGGSRIERGSGVSSRPSVAPSGSLATEVSVPQPQPVRWRFPVADAETDAEKDAKYLTRLVKKAGYRAPPILGQSLEELERLVASCGPYPLYRAKQLLEGALKGARTLDDISALPKGLREALRERGVDVGRLDERAEGAAGASGPGQVAAPLRVFKSEDGTVKFLRRLPDGPLVETVGIPNESWSNSTEDDGEDEAELGNVPRGRASDRRGGSRGGSIANARSRHFENAPPSSSSSSSSVPDRLTVCVSSQAGCPMACTFCATGRGGFSRSLLPSEILDQLLTVQEHFGRRATNVVFMGMGEPCLNLPAVMKAARAMVRDVGIGARRVTLSTVGVPGTIEKVARETVGKAAVAWQVEEKAPGAGERDGAMRKDGLMTAQGAQLDVERKGTNQESEQAAGGGDAIVNPGGPQRQLAESPASPTPATSETPSDARTSASSLQGPIATPASSSPTSPSPAPSSSAPLSPAPPVAFAHAPLPPLQLTFAISLHAPEQASRARIVPSAKAYPLDAIADDAQRYCFVTGRRISFEYTLLQGQNASARDAELLADLIDARPRLMAHVNLIPWNPNPDAPFREPEARQVRAFADVLRARNIPVSIRVPRGRGAAAACGQLRNEQQGIKTKRS